MADENRLWGAPRIHGELLKLGIAVSERTVSRYLRDRPSAPSQTWSTFLANHIGQLTFIAPTTSPYAPHADDIIDVSGLPFCHTPLSNDEFYVCHRGVVVDWSASLHRTPGGTQTVLDARHTMAIRNRSGRGPPVARIWCADRRCLRAASLPLHSTCATNDGF